MAPSADAVGMGWGVFAGRAFQEGEVVEMAPGMIPLDQDSPSILDSALEDYVYGYYRLIGGIPKPGQQHPPSIQYMQAVMLGMGMIYNHHPESPNLEYTTFGREPAPDVPSAANAIGFKALRDIAAGEELFSTYGKEDGGVDWFQRRNLQMQNPANNVERSRIPLEDLPEWKSQYCSKIVAGLGQPTWKNRVLPILPPPQYVPFWMDPQWLAPWDAEMGAAVAKVAVTQGERLELGTGMILSQKHHVRGTALAAVALAWQDLDPNHHQTALQELRQRGQLKLQYNEWTSESSWRRTDGFSSWDDVAILPIGGSIGLVSRHGRRRQGREEEEEIDAGDEEDVTMTNCRLVIPTTSGGPQEPGSVVVPLELIATQDIAAGELLRLDLPPSGTPQEVALLQKELRLMGRVPSSASRFHLDPNHSNKKDEL